MLIKFIYPFDLLSLNEVSNYIRNLHMFKGNHMWLVITVFYRLLVNTNKYNIAFHTHDDTKHMMYLQWVNGRLSAIIHSKAVK